ncbi:MAG: acyl-CoA dehydratase activase [bacterium]
MITCGVDIGARTIDVVLFNGEVLLDNSVISTGARPRERAESAYNDILKNAGLRKSDLHKTLATGYGRHHFQLAESVSSEIMCHAAGVKYFFPHVRTIIDIGGQDSKVIHMDADGRVHHFAMNDRCAAGTGRFIEMVAQILDITVEESGQLALKAKETCQISSMCAVFAESEIVGLVQNNVPPETILRSAFESIAKRTISLMSGKKPEGEIVFTGGVARNDGVHKAVEEVTRSSIIRPSNPQITGALGAAIIARK